MPVTLATLAVSLTAALLSPAMTVIAVALYLAVGALGVPVFSGFAGGVGVLAGPTGGYLVGYLPAATLTSVLISLRRRRDRRSAAADIAVRAGAMVTGTVVLYTLGTAWFVISQKTSLAAAISVCVLPFLAGDAAKIALAAIVSERLDRLARKLRLR